MTEVKRKSGRPKAEAKASLLDQVFKLAAINCTWKEIASVVGMNEETMQRRKDITTAYKNGIEHGKSSLRRKMFETAMNGSIPMMIWLSKNMLGYTDTQIIRNIDEPKDSKLIIDLSGNNAPKPELIEVENDSKSYSVQDSNGAPTQRFEGNSGSAD